MIGAVPWSVGASGPGVVASRRNQDVGKVLELRKIKLQWSRAASANDQAHAALLHSRHRFGSGFSIVLSVHFAASSTPSSCRR